MARGFFEAAVEIFQKNVYPSSMSAPSVRALVAPVLTAVLWLAFCGGGAAGESEGSQKSVKLLYLGAIGYGFGFDFVNPINQLLHISGDKSKSERLKEGLIFRSGNRYLLDSPDGIGRKDLPREIGREASRKRIVVLETPRSILAPEPQFGDYPIVDKLFGITRAWGTNGWFQPGVRKRQAEIIEFEDASGRRFQALEMPEKLEGGFWHRNLRDVYRLNIEGQSVGVTIISKPLGGHSKIIPAFEKRLGELQEEPLKLNLGNWVEREEWAREWGFDPGLYIQALDELKVERLAFHPSDLRRFWGDAALLNRQNKSSRPFVFVGANLETKDSSEGKPIEPYVIREMNGIRIGIMSLVSPKWESDFAQHNLPVQIKDPIRAAQEIADELKGNHRVDVLVAVSYLRSDEEMRLTSEVKGIDILLGREVEEAATKRRRVVELKHWNEEYHTQPALIAYRPEHSFGEITLGFSPGEAEAELASVIEETPGPIGADRPETEKLHMLVDAMIDSELAPQESVLPDPNRLWPGHGQYRTIETYNLGAGILRRAAQTEVALVGVNVRLSNTGGEVPANIVRQWFSSEKKMMTVKLPGHALRALMKNIDFQAVPVEKEAVPPEVKYGQRTWLAAAGLDENGLVNGLPIQEEEYYTVALTDDLLRQPEDLPALRHAAETTESDLVIDKLVVDWLKQRKRRYEMEAGVSSKETALREYEEDIRSLAEGRAAERPVWRLNLRNLSFEFANTRVQNAAPFNQVRNARIRSLDQILVQASSQLFSEFHWKDFRLDAGVSADYGRVTLKPAGSPAIDNETIDQVILETELRYKALEFGRGYGRHHLGPFVNLAYDTEFTRPETLPRRKLLRVQPGVKVFEGSLLQEFRLGGVIESDYSTGAASTLYGWETGLVWSSPVPGSPMRVKAVLSYRQFAPSRFDTLDDLKRELGVNLRFQMPILGNLRLSPFVDFYLFQGKLVPETGHNLVFGVALDYSRLWKPVF
ncbi:MAG: hypothetical protein HY611_06235 [Elusimicrobia bacterium]|nr:hypothetical protein [Elusimicrobiota bacterium]